MAHDAPARLADHVPETLQHQRHALATAHALHAELDGSHDHAAALHADAAGRWAEFGDVLEEAHALLGRSRCLIRLANPAAEEPTRRARAVRGHGRPGSQALYGGVAPRVEE